MLKASPKSLVFLAFIVMLGIFIGFYAWMSHDLKDNLEHSSNERIVLYNLACLDKFNSSLNTIERSSKPYLIQKRIWSIQDIVKNYGIAFEALGQLKKTVATSF